MIAAEPRPFRLADGVPSGVTLLEASAGTGKTHTIAALAVRYLAEGLAVDRLLAVTFTRSATGELRDRVRSRLVSAEAGLRSFLAGQRPESDDLVDLLASGTPNSVAARHLALADALADFDAATIATIHGFCEQALDGLGTAADCGRDLRFVDDDTDLIDQVVDDFYLRKFSGSDDPALTRIEARRIVGVAVSNRDATITPADAPAGTADALRVSLATRGRQEVLRRARMAGTMTYDDQLHRLRDSLTGPSGEAAVRRLRERFAVVLVDEFQDTDPVQWEIFRTAFARAGTPLLLIGDPKQAIYSFRGADVLAYLDAAASADHRSTLGTNWRSDGPLVDAFNALLAGASLGHVEIPYRRVVAAPHHLDSGLAGAPAPSALRLRLVHRDDGLMTLTNRKYAQADSAREAVAADLAADVVRLLSSGATLPTAGSGGGVVGGAVNDGGGGGGVGGGVGGVGGGGGGGVGGVEQVAPGHLAVLVRANYEAVIVHRALRDVGVPAVIGAGGSVFATAAGSDWLTLLEALEQPAATARARAAALSPFVGWDARRLVSALPAEVDALQSTLHRWAGVLDGSGVAALMATITSEVRLVARELTRAGGERRLTDMQHVAELLHAEALTSGAGARALTAWLRERISDAGRDTGAEERSRRLESDAVAVQVLTVHRSKGLEYPIVYLPYLWMTANDNRDRLPLYHDPGPGSVSDPASDPDSGMGRRSGSGTGARSSSGLGRSLDVGLSSPAHLQHEGLADAEQLGEDLRQAYVALTRARHQVVAWWASGHQVCRSPIGRLLLGRGADGSIPPGQAPMPKSDDVVWSAMVDLAGRAPGRISAERVGSISGDLWQAPQAAGADLLVRVFERNLDTVWRRASYSAITAAAHGAAAEPLVSSEIESPGGTDEAEIPPSPEAAPSAGSFGGGGVSSDRAISGDEPWAPGERSQEAELRAMRLPMANLPAGAAFGILVHSVFEGVDFASSDLDEDLAALVAGANRPRAPTVGDLDPILLTSALRDVIDTPLGPLTGGHCLRDVGRADRLNELVFELPLVGGDHPRSPLSVSDVAACLRRLLPASDPLVAYPDRLDDPAVAQVLRGYLTGSIDMVIRHRADDRERYVVVDYKTNWLGPPGLALSAWDYRRSRLIGAMAAEHYPLQAVLYSVALHRYLRWRKADYDPHQHLGGVLYLFVRGMAGPGTPTVDGTPCGVFDWRPPPQMTVELSDLLDTGDRGTA